MAITPFKVIQGHPPILVPVESPYDLINNNLPPILYQIFAIDRGVPHFNAAAGGDPLRISR